MCEDHERVAIVDLASGRFLAPNGRWSRAVNGALLLCRDEAERWIDRFGCCPAAFAVAEREPQLTAA